MRKSFVFPLLTQEQAIHFIGVAFSGNHPLDRDRINAAFKGARWVTPAAILTAELPLFVSTYLSLCCFPSDFQRLHASVTILDYCDDPGSGDFGLGDCVAPPSVGFFASATERVRTVVKPRLDESPDWTGKSSLQRAISRVIDGNEIPAKAIPFLQCSIENLPSWSLSAKTCDEYNPLLKPLRLLRERLFLAMDAYGISEVFPAKHS